MNYLQYTSDEMFSATQLIRKSKKIFDDIENRKIEKGVILRDGKPSFIMLEFRQYEKLMKRLIELEQEENKTIEAIENSAIDDLNIDNLEIINEEKITQEDKQTYKLDDKKIEKNSKDAILEKLDSIEGIINNDNKKNEDKYKEFWE